MMFPGGAGFIHKEFPPAYKSGRVVVRSPVRWVHPAHRYDFLYKYGTGDRVYGLLYLFPGRGVYRLLWGG